MLGIGYLKSTPTTYVIQFKKGKITKKGPGLSYFYFAPNSVNVKIPISSQDVPFIFEETSKDIQDVTVQGELTFVVNDPEKLASVLDYSVDARGRFESEDPDKLNDRLINALQICARSFIQKTDLVELLTGSKTLIEQTLAELENAKAFEAYGVEILDITISSIKGTPEMMKALQADAREKLLQQADEAIHVRRNTAVQLEREIKENELETEKVVDQRKREISEAKIKGDIALEQQRTELVEQKVINEGKESQARAESLRAVIEPIKDVDWKNLLAASANSADAKTIIAMAFQSIAENTDKIENLNISPDLLQTLLNHSDNE